MSAAGTLFRRIAVSVAALVLLAGCTSGSAISDSDQVIADAYEHRLNDLQVSGSGVVVRTLSDDTNGDRHQRFILELESGQTLLITHNIDVAPRIPTLLAGDAIEFYGVYEWNDEGGLIHWTHHDPAGVHEAGWLKHAGVVYQ